jgi:hypothetical protein
VAQYARQRNESQQALKKTTPAKPRRQMPRLLAPRISGRHAKCFRNVGEEDLLMDTEVISGLRCRARRPIPHPRGIVRRSSEGTVRSARENLGRQLITVDFDSGEKLVLFPHEIELIDESVVALHS